MQLLTKYLLLFAIILLVTVPCAAHRRRSRRMHVSARRIYRHVPQFPHRIIRSRMDCRAHERYVRCGPEQHCDMSCANLFSPPHCFNPHQNHPKCFHPRCVCVSGYVRDKNGFCIRQWKCSGRYFGLSNDFYNTDNENTSNRGFQFRIHTRKAKHSRSVPAYNRHYGTQWMRKHFW